MTSWEKIKYKIGGEQTSEYLNSLQFATHAVQFLAQLLVSQLGSAQCLLNEWVYLLDNEGKEPQWAQWGMQR